METFYITFGFVGAICAGVGLLAGFFTLLSWLKRLTHPSGIVEFRALSKSGKLVNVHLSGGKILQRYRFIGFSDNASLKGGGLPYQLANMLVLESATGARTYLRADSVKMIEELDIEQAASVTPDR
jgi:hypothetical protein